MATRSQCCHFKFRRALLSSDLAPFSCALQDVRVLYFNERCVISSRGRQDISESHAGYKILPVTDVKLSNEPLNTHMSALFIPDVRRKVVMRGIHLVVKGMCRL